MQEVDETCLFGHAGERASVPVKRRRVVCWVHVEDMTSYVPLVPFLYGIPTFASCIFYAATKLGLLDVMMYNFCYRYPFPGNEVTMNVSS